VADGVAALKAQALRHVDLADEALLHGGEGLHLERSAAVLRTDLHHLLGVLLHLHHLLAFIDVVAGRLFAVDVLTGLHGPYGGQRVPVIRRRDGHSVYAGICEGLAHIFKLFGLLAGVLQQGGVGDFAGGLVHVAYRCDARLGQPRVRIQVIGTATTDTYDGYIDLVIRAPNTGGSGGCHGAKKKSAGSRI